MGWEDDLQNTMFIGEKLVWKCKVKKPPDTGYVEATGWIDEEVYFTTNRILWNITARMPQSVPYESFGGIQTGPPGSGGFAGVKATASGGGVIDIASNVKSTSLQFSNSDTLQFAEWLLREVVSGHPLKTAEGMPEIVGTRDPNAPPPAPKEGCFIAMATCTPNSYEVFYLSKFRDEILTESALGRRFVSSYYAISPTLAPIIYNFKPLQVIMRVTFIKPLVSVLYRFIPLK